jgi:uncharacterized membrane protein
MQRLKSIDSFRGLIMFLMLWVHLVGWWSSDAAQWLDYGTYVFIDRTLAPGFLFLSGMSAMLYYKTGMKKIQGLGKNAYHLLRNEYLIRAFCIFVLGLIFNVFIAILDNNPLHIWKWFLLLTIGISLLLVWPFFRISLYLKIIFAVSIWIMNYFLLSFLLPFQGQTNTQGILFYFFYNSVDLEPIVATFSFTLLGSAVGEIIYNIFENNDQKDYKRKLNYNLIYPSLIIGPILVILAIFFGYPQTLSANSFSWIAISVGFNIITLSLFLIIEEYELFKTKKDYRFLYYFSYYSLTFYIAHNIFYLLLLNQFDVFPMFIAFSVAAFFVFVIFKKLYNSKWKTKASIKIQVGRFAKAAAKRIDERKLKIKN